MMQFLFASKWVPLFLLELSHQNSLRNKNLKIEIVNFTLKMHFISLLM